jgi:lysophospholipase L1-like esterase
MAMHRKTIQWIMVVSAISGLVWLGGLAWTLQDYLGGAPEVLTAAAKAPAVTDEAGTTAPTAGQEQQQKKDQGLRLLTLGDSLTRGAGDPDGKGYVGYLLEGLKEKSKEEITLVNYGIDGQTSPQLAELLKDGKVLEDVKAADIIALTIGGNDLFQGGATLQNLDAANIRKIEDGYLRQLDMILKALREKNDDARIYLIGLYNPFIALQNSAVTTKIVRDWNYKTAETVAAYPQTVFVPTLDLFQLKVQDYLALDMFHPNGTGHRLIGDRVASLITLEGEGQ